MNKDQVDAALDETYDALADEYDFDEVAFVNECVSGFIFNLNKRLDNVHPQVRTFIDELLKNLSE
jgi:hypothetical protein